MNILLRLVSIPFMALGALLKVLLAGFTKQNSSRKEEQLDPPACLRDPTLGRHGYLTLQGMRFHYVENGDRSKPLILCVHGFPEFWYSWRHQLREFSKEYWVVAVDLRGYGDSDKPKEAENYKLRLLVEDVKNIIHGLGRSKCILLAHDWGGLLGWDFLRRYPDMVEKFVIMNGPPPEVYIQGVFTIPQQFFTSLYTFAFQLPWLAEFLMRSLDSMSFDSILRGGKAASNITEEDVTAYKYAFKDPGSFVYGVNYYKENGPRFIFRWLNSKKSQKRITVPGMYLFGEKDSYIHLGLLKKMKNYSDNLRIEVVKGANHFVQQDDPRNVNRLIWSLLEN